MRVRARCNKRSCQARRTFKHHIDPNDPPKCHKPGCNGTMYVIPDRNKDRCAELCRCDGLPFMNRDGNAPHRKGIRGCKHHLDYMLEMSLTKGTKKHSPVKREELTTTEEPDW